MGEVNAWCTAVQAPEPTATSVVSATASNSGASTIHTNDQADSSIRSSRRPISSRVAPSSARACGRAAGGEEHAVARLGPDRGRQPVPLGVGEVLGHRPAELAVVTEQDVGQPAGAALLGPFLPGVERAARLRRSAGHDDRADVVGLEDPERGVAEVGR